MAAEIRQAASSRLVFQSPDGSLFPIFPLPKVMSFTGGRVHLDKPTLGLSSLEHPDCPARALLERMPDDWAEVQERTLQTAYARHPGHTGETQPVRIAHDQRMPDQAYHLHISQSGVEIKSGSEAGLHFATVTLRQLFFLFGAEMPALRIEDQPDFKTRGVLIDIGRGKIPQMETLYFLVDMLSDLKINHLQLYMEGYSFKYPSYAGFFPDEAPITAEEIRALDKYARERFIELVPCQNCLGHMEAWLALPAFNNLAEVPEGMPLVPGLPPKATTLDPTDPRSCKFVQTLLDDLLPHFTSDQVNICMDEPYELGHGKSKALASRIGISGIYLDFLDKVLRIVARHGKKVCMWGDVLINGIGQLKSVPDGVTVLDWLYEGKSSFEDHARALFEKRIPFMVCPGTSSWNSIAGRTDNMLANILDAAEQGIHYGAAGLLVTDWGDYGHWQTLPVSYAGYAYAAAFSWNLEGNRLLDAAAYLDTFIFMDGNRVMGRFWQDLGNYYLYENAILPNMTLTFLALSPLTCWSARSGLDEKLNLYYQLIQTLGGVFGRYPFDLQRDYDFHGLKDFLAIMSSHLELNGMCCENRETVYREASYTLQLISHGVDLYQFSHEMTILSHDETKKRLAYMLDDLAKILDAFFQLWPGRNRKGASVNRNAMGFHILMARYREQLDQSDEKEVAPVILF